MASCKVRDDKTYMVNFISFETILKIGFYSTQICVDIMTSTFSLTKIITLSPAIVIINQTSV